MTDDNKKEEVVHTPENSWFDGEKWIPVEMMTANHLRKANLYAQKKEEYFWRKSTEFSKMVEMLEAEGERRGIKLPIYKSKYQKNNHKMKEAVKQMP